MAVTFDSREIHLLERCGKAYGFRDFRPRGNLAPFGVERAFDVEIRTSVVNKNQHQPERKGPETREGVPVPDHLNFPGGLNLLKIPHCHTSATGWTPNPLRMGL